MSPARWFRLAGACGLAVVLWFVLPGRTEEAKGKSHALLVGVKDYGERAALGGLKYTENDVEEVAKLLDRPGSPFRGNVRVLTCSRGKSKKEDAPTAANIKKALAALIKGKKSGDTVLVALAGHGVQLEVKDPKAKQKPKSYAYFCPQDADLPGADYETGQHERLVLLSDLLGDLGDCGAGTKLLLMDACRNERASRSLRLNKELVPDGVAALFSCKTGQVAFETDKLGKGHGIFFHYVIEALKGEARNRRGQVTWSGLVDFVTDKVADEVPVVIGGGASQTPHEIKNFAGKTPVLLSLAEGAEKEFTNSAGMKFVRIKPGKFMMGSPRDEKDRNADEHQHEVEITRAFYLAVHETTQKQYKAVTGQTPSQFSRNGSGKDSVKDVRDEDLDQFPVENVSWDDAQEFIKKLNADPAEKKAGRVYRLPREAEWEYACRAGTTTTFHTGGTLSDRQANYADSKLNRPCKVGSYKPNAWGLYDMIGNVSEWCADWYGEKYFEESPKRDPAGPNTGTLRLLRGGGYPLSDKWCRSAVRDKTGPGGRYSFQGFRIALTAPEK